MKNGIKQPILTARSPNRSERAVSAEIRAVRTDVGQLAKVLLVSGDREATELAKTRLSAADLQVESVGTVQQALDACIQSRPNVVVADLDLDLDPEALSGLALSHELKSRWPDLVVIVVTTHTSVAEGIHATQKGAFSYLVKPVAKSELLDHVKRAIAVSTYRGKDHDWRADLTARSRLMDQRIEAANGAAGSDAPVLLTGQNGTGKELFAHAIHAASTRRDAAFIAVSCVAAVESWLEHALFGPQDATSSDAADPDDGALFAARNGTLYVEEIGNMPLSLQARFSASLNDGARLICTTSSDLKRLVEVGQFSQALFDQISVAPIEIAPLGRRREDIPLLISHFLEQAQDPVSRRKLYGARDIELLATKNWPTNVQQLFDLVKRGAALSQADNPSVPDESEPDGLTLDEARDQFTRAYLAEKLRLTDGNVTQSARLAKRNRTDFYKLLAKHRLNADDFKPVASKVEPAARSFFSSSWK